MLPLNVEIGLFLNWTLGASFGDFSLTPALFLDLWQGVQSLIQVYLLILGVTLLFNRQMGRTCGIAHQATGLREYRQWAW